MPETKEITHPLAEAVCMFEDIVDDLRHIRAACRDARKFGPEDRAHAATLALIPAASAEAIRYVIRALRAFPDGETLAATALRDKNNHVTGTSTHRHAY